MVNRYDWTMHKTEDAYYVTMEEQEYGDWVKWVHYVQLELKIERLNDKIEKLENQLGEKNVG